MGNPNRDRSPLPTPERCNVSESRGATGNVLLAATTAKGVTVLENANASPAIIDLGEMLSAMGVHMIGLETYVIRIEGVTALDATDYTVPSDEIEVETLPLSGIVT